MKYRLISIFTAVLAVISCKPNITPEPEVTPVALSAKVESVTLTGFDVIVDISEAASFYIANYKLSDFEGVTQEKIVEQLTERVNLGASWGSILKIGSQKISYNNLMSDSDYRTIVFGLRADGTVSTDAVILETHTPSFSAEAKLVDKTPFSFTVEVTPDRNDIAWFGQVFIGDGSRVSDETLLQYIRYYIGLYHSEGMSYEELTTTGHGFFEDECEPGLNYIFTVVAVDKSLRVVSGVTRCTFVATYDGLQMIDDKTSEHIHTALYAYNNDEVGVLLSYTGYDEAAPGYPDNAIAFNANSQYGVDLYSMSDDKAADVLADARQAQKESYCLLYPEYFQDCKTGSDYASVLQWGDTKYYAEYGNLWSRVLVEDVVDNFGEDLDRLCLVATIEDFDSDLNVVCKEYCISRADFSDLGYEFTASASAAKSVKASRSASAVMNAETGEMKSVERKVLGTIKKKAL